MQAINEVASKEIKIHIRIMSLELMHKIIKFGGILKDRASLFSIEEFTKKWLN